MPLLNALYGTHCRDKMHCIRSKSDREREERINDREEIEKKKKNEKRGRQTPFCHYKLHLD